MEILTALLLVRVTVGMKRNEFFDILKRLMNASDNMNEVIWHPAGGGHIEIIELFFRKVLREATFDGAMATAAEGGHVKIVELCKEWGAPNFDQTTMVYVALFGHVEIVELCEEWGTTDFDGAMAAVAEGGHVKIVKLCKEWGSAEAEGDRVEIKKICREWGGFGDIHRELFQYHHKRKFF